MGQSEDFLPESFHKEREKGKDRIITFTICCYDDAGSAHGSAVVLLHFFALFTMSSFEKTFLREREKKGRGIVPWYSQILFFYIFF